MDEELEIKLALKILQLNIENATVENIKSQYIKLAKAYHPDKNSNNATFVKLFADLNDAYSMLKSKYGIVKIIRENKLKIIDEEGALLAKSERCQMCSSNVNYSLLVHNSSKVCNTCFQSLALQEQKTQLKKYQEQMYRQMNSVEKQPINVNVNQSNNQSQTNKGTGKFLKFLILVVILIIIVSIVVGLVVHFKK